MEKVEQVKDCPFCGSEATARHFADAVIHEGKRTPNHYVECCGCWAGTVASPDRDAAIAKWNTRANDEEIARLRSERDDLLEALDNLENAYCALCEMTGKDFHKGNLSHATHARAVIARIKGASNA